MELADPAVLKSLTESQGQPRQRQSYARMTRYRAGASQGYAPPVAKTQAFRCRCGTCAQCAENARWERIFQERFADPDYYSRRVIRSESSLNNW